MALFILLAYFHILYDVEHLDLYLIIRKINKEFNVHMLFL